MKRTYLGENGLSTSVAITLFLFFFIFGLPTPLGSITPLLTVIVLFMGFINFKKYFLYIPKPILFLFLFLIFDILVCLFIPIILGTYDFSIIQTKVNFFVSILAVYIIAKFLASDTLIKEKNFFKLLLTIFCLQVSLVVLMLVNSDISNIITSFTRSSEQGVRVLEAYAGARGLGVADSSAFGLAIVMGLFMLITFYAYKNKFIKFKFFILIILLGSVASISAGRTAILGIFLGVLYLLTSIKNYRTLLTLFSISIIGVCTFIFLLSLDRNSIQNETLGYFYSYSMEPILNYINTGSLSSSSTSALFNMYFPLTEKQFLIGDGRYTLEDKYYLETDAGYMRFALFYGIIFSMFLYVSFFIFVIKIAFFTKKHAVFLFILLVFSFLLHYKGEVVLFSIAYNKLLFLIIFFIYIKCFFETK